jgi:hypothetical protein
MRRGEKIPHIKDWVNRASSDPNQIAAWEREFPGCRWGRLCGISFDVLDADPDALAWAQENEALLRTYTQKTPRGSHFYFAPAVPGLVSRAVRAVPGLDAKAAGSIAIDYEREGYPTIEIPMVPMSRTLVELLGHCAERLR